MRDKYLQRLQSRLYILICLACLSGCVNYSGIHSNAQPLDDKLLSSSYHETHTPPKTAAIKKINWWTAFKDPKLNELENTALADSPSIAIAQSRVRAAQQVAEASGAKLWPTADGYAQIARERITRNGLFPPPYGGNSYTETNLGAEYSYELDFFGKNRQLIASSIDSAHASEADLAEARLVLSAAVAKAYFQLQYNVAELQNETLILHQQQEILDIIKDRAQHGIDSDIPVSSTVADMETIKVTVAQLQEHVKLAQHQLATLIGVNPFTAQIKLNKFAYQKHYFALPTIIPANLLGQRPDLIAARWRMEAAAHEVNAQKARFYPNVNLLGFLSLQSYNLSKALILPSRDMSTGLAIDLPIFDAGKRRADLGEKYAEYDNAVGFYNNTLLTGLQQVADGVTELSSVHTQQLAQLNVLKATQHNYELIRTRYQHGIVDYSHVLVIKNTLLRRQNEEIELQTEHLNAMVALIKAVGGSYLTVEG